MVPLDLPLNLLCPVISFGVTSLLLLLLTGRWAHIVLDHPNERSLHAQPVPRTGGIALAAGVAACVAPMWTMELGPVWVSAALLLLVSMLDDMVGLPVIGRLAVHCLVAAGLVWYLLLASHGIVWSAVAVLAVVWMTNLYNFMDGMDGLAGGMAIFGFGFYALAGVLSSHLPFAVTNAAIAVAAGAFLLFNFHPARIFMGDAGSTFLGFLAASLGLVGWQLGIWTLWFPGLVFSPFVVDATVTLARRLLQGEKVWHAHRKHYYQRLVLAGWGHRRTVVVEYVLMCASGSIAVLHDRLGEAERMSLLGGWVLMYVLLAHVVRRLERRGVRA